MRDYRVDEKGNDLELNVNCVDVNKVRELLNMALTDVTPNGNYGDYELTVYEAMCRILRINGIDRYYIEFARAMNKIDEEVTNVTLTEAEIEERNAVAEEILRGILNK